MYVLYQLIERTEAHADLLTKYRFWIIPVFNPDGYDYSMTFKRVSYIYIHDLFLTANIFIFYLIIAKLRFIFTNTVSTILCLLTVFKLLLSNKLFNRIYASILVKSLCN